MSKGYSGFEPPRNVPNVVPDPSGVTRTRNVSMSEVSTRLPRTAWVGLLTGKSLDAVCPETHTWPEGSSAITGQYSLDEPPMNVEYSSAFPAAFKRVNVTSMPPSSSVARTPLT